MPYSSNAELPANVRSSLSDADQTKFRETFNSALEQYGDEETAFKVAWSVVKKSEDCRSFGGWLSVEKIDSQGDVVEIDALHDAVKKYINRGGPIMDEHTNRQIGTLYNATVGEHPTGRKALFGFGTIFVGERIYDNVWSEIKAGKKPGLSIGGDALKEQTVCDANKCWNVVKKMHIFELSPCIRPANHDSLITEVNTKAKAQENDVSDKEEKKEDELPTEDRPQASVIQEVLQKILALVSDVHAKVTAPKPTEEPPKEPPEEKKPEEKPVEGETAEEPEEKKDVSKMQKTEEVKPKEEPKPIENKEKVEQPAAQPIQQAPPVQAPPPTNPAPIPQPSTIVETPRPGVVEQGSSANDLWKDPAALKKMSMREISRLYHPK